MLRESLNTPARQELPVTECLREVTQGIGDRWAEFPVLAGLAAYDGLFHDISIDQLYQLTIVEPPTQSDGDFFANAIQVPVPDAVRQQLKEQRNASLNVGGVRDPNRVVFS